MSEAEEAKKRPEGEAPPPSGDEETAAQEPAEVVAAADAEERPIIITVDNFFRRSSGPEVCLTKLQEEIEPKPFFGQVAHVTRKYGVTINLDNYESARVEVGVTVPCYLPDIDRADTWAQKFIESKLTEEVTTIRGSDNKSNSGHL